MILSIDKDSLVTYTTIQLNNFFDDGNYVEKSTLKRYIDDTLSRLIFCFNKIKKPYYYIDGKSVFNHLNGDHYSMYLYLLSNTVWETDKNISLASKIFLLNKTLHGIDAFYAVKLPDIFLFVHPLGTVLGNAKYSDYFVVYQNCTIGATEELIYPSFEKEIIMFSQSTVIGNCKIGSNTIFGSNSFLINTNVRNDSTIVNSYPNHKILINKVNVIDRMFK